MQFAVTSGDDIRTGNKRVKEGGQTDRTVERRVSVKQNGETKNDKEVFHPHKLGFANN